jgi:hypothetical protein
LNPLGYSAVPMVVLALPLMESAQMKLVAPSRLRYRQIQARLRQMESARMKSAALSRLGQAWRQRWLWVKKVGVVTISLVLAVVLGTVGNLGTITRTGENGVVGNVCHAIVKATSILNDIIRSNLATRQYLHCDG